MKDRYSEVQIGQLHPKSRSVFKQFIEDAENNLNVTLRIVSGYRTFETQQKIYNQGRLPEYPGPIVTRAKPGFSYHCYGLAADLAELIEGRENFKFNYSLLVPIARKYLLRWGGNFKSIHDEPHFELSFGFSVYELLDRYMKGNFIPGTNYVNLD